MPKCISVKCLRIFVCLTIIIDLNLYKTLNLTLITYSTYFIFEGDSALCTGNLGNLPIIIVPAVCKESDSPFGDTTTCSTYGEAYASISMGVCSMFAFCKGNSNIHY